MPDADDILEETMQPKRIKGDMGEVEETSASEKTEADRYAKTSDGASKPHLGFRFRRIIGPNANGS